MHDDTIGDALFDAILRYCGDLPFPFGVTDFQEQAEWSRIMLSVRADLGRKVISRLQSQGMQIAGVSKEQIREYAEEVVKQGLELLQRPTSDVFEDGGREFQEWLKK